MRNEKTRFLVFTALMIALMAVLQITGLGLIKLGVINVTLYCTLLAIGTLTLGLKSGLALGFTFGAFSLWSALSSPSALVAPLLNASQLFVIALCFLPRMLVPIVIYLIGRVPSKRTSVVNVVAAAVGSLTNTFLYLGLLLVGYAVTVSSYPALLATVGSIALCGGIPEAILAALLTPPIVLALNKILHR